MSTQPAKLCGVPQEIERSVSRAHLAHSMGYKANFDRAELFADREPFFLSSGRGDLLRKVLLGSLKTSRIQRFISLCSVRIQASPFRISFKFLFQVPAIYPAWRRKEVEFERFIAVEDKDRARAHTRIAE